MKSTHDSELRLGLLIYILTVSLLLFLLSIFLPSEVDDAIYIFKFLEKLSTNYIYDAVAMANGSAHPAALKITYIVSIFFSFIGAILLASIVLKRNPDVILGKKPNESISPAFLTLAAALLVSTPFLPLLPANGLRIFDLLQKNIQQDRVFLGVWNILFFLGYSAFIFFLALNIFSSIRRIFK